MHIFKDLSLLYFVHCFCCCCFCFVFLLLQLKVLHIIYLPVVTYSYKFYS